MSINDNTASDSAVTPLPVEDSKATRLFKLMGRLAVDEMKRYKREQVLYFPFFITDSQLEEFDKDITKALNSVPSVESIEFVGVVHFDDLSSQRFDDFEQFLDRAGKRKDPQSIRLSWNKFAIDSNGEVISGQVELLFVTEKRIKTGRDNQDSIPKAKTEVTVSGSEQRWVDQLFDDLVPILKTTAHGGLMRPLWVFQNSSFVQLINVLAVVSALIAVLRFAERRHLFDSAEQEAKVLKTIHAANTISEKINLYINWELRPKPFHLSQFIASVVVAGFAAFIIFATGEKILPLLTPSSAIAIGAAKRRALSGLDVFKFIFFTIILGIIVIPLLKYGFSLLWELISM